jgi:hypothetical protein
MYLFLFSCSAQKNKFDEEFETSRRLFQYIERNDTASIRDIIGINPKDIGSSYVALFNTASIIKRVLLEHEKGFEDFEIEYREYSSQSPKLVDIVIILEKLGDGIQSKKVVVEFVKYTKKDKIYDFFIETPVDIKGASIPQRGH